ncbi:MAG: efflux RND transporter periplasmic adaptor subunit [Clostridium sp.]
MHTKKKKKWIILGIVLLAVIGLIIFFVTKPKNQEFEEVKTQTGDITTYYSFSGNVESKEKQSVLADKMMQISSIHVQEGDAVHKDDILMETTAGEQIKAEIDGEVTKLYVEEGSPVTAGSQLIDLVNYDHLQVTVKVDEYDVKAVQEGKEATVNIGALDNKKVTGTISKVSRQAVVANGISYFTASIDLPEDQEVLVGMSAEVEMVNQQVSGVTILDMDALQFDSYNHPYVYYRNEQGKVDTKSVEVGINDGNTAEITEGLQPGETILVPKKNGMEAMMQEMSRNGGGKADE